MLKRAIDFVTSERFSYLDATGIVFALQFVITTAPAVNNVVGTLIVASAAFGFCVVFIAAGFFLRRIFVGSK